MLLPAVTLAAMFFWSLFRPAAVPPPIVFLIGLLLDLLGYLPIGAGVLTLLLVHGLAARWRRRLTQQGFIVVWLAYVGVGAGASALIWALTSLLSLRLMPIGPALFQATLTGALYPALAIVLIGAHRTIADPERVSTCARPNPRRKQGQGSALKPARGLCPLDPHQRQRPLDSIFWSG